MFDRGPDGRFLPGSPAIERFIAKCKFDPYTGCVLWTGGLSRGGGRHAQYGIFRPDRGPPIRAHRWAAKHIHGFDINGWHIDHCCPAGPNRLCVQHVQPLTFAENRYLQHTREPADPESFSIPYFLPPAWLTEGTTVHA